MTAGPDVTLAASTGPIWLLLVIHVLGGGVAIASGFAAVVVAKGGQSHRRAGMAFVVSMMAMTGFGAVVAAYEMKMTAVAAIATGYYVFTGLTTVRPIAGTGRTQHIVLMTVAVLVALFDLTVGFTALGMPRRMINGVPAGVPLLSGTIALLAAIGDWRLIRAGGIQGTRKLARHLWRMCFALFVASGSFFLGQMRFVPEPVRSLPLMMALGFAPLVALAYWMWRVRLRHSLRGLTLTGGSELPKYVQLSRRGT